MNRNSGTAVSVSFDSMLNVFWTSRSKMRFEKMWWIRSGVA